MLLRDGLQTCLQLREEVASVGGSRVLQGGQRLGLEWTGGSGGGGSGKQQKVIGAAWRSPLRSTCLNTALWIAGSTACFAAFVGPSKSAQSLLAALDSDVDEYSPEGTIWGFGVMHSQAAQHGPAGPAPPAVRLGCPATLLPSFDCKPD